MSKLAARAAIIAFGLVVLTLTGCSIGSPVPEPPPTCQAGTEIPACADPISFEEMVAEWSMTRDGLDLPAGVSLESPSLDQYGDQSGDQSFEPGYGAVLAHEGWFCSWQRQWLGLSDKPDDEAVDAMKQLRAFLMTTTYRDAYREHPAIDRMLDQAEDGDSTALAARFQVTC